MNFLYNPDISLPFKGWYACLEKGIIVALSNLSPCNDQFWSCVAFAREVLALLCQAFISCQWLNTVLVIK